MLRYILRGALSCCLAAGLAAVVQGSDAGDVEVCKLAVEKSIRRLREMLAAW